MLVLVCRKVRKKNTRVVDIVYENKESTLWPGISGECLADYRLRPSAFLTREMVNNRVGRISASLSFSNLAIRKGLRAFWPAVSPFQPIKTIKLAIKSLDPFSRDFPFRPVADAIRNRKPDAARPRAILSTLFSDFPRDFDLSIG